MPLAHHHESSIWFTDQGVGQPVLLIHGGFLEPMDGKRFWETPGVASGLAERGYRVLVPDRRLSTGQTSTPFEIASWDLEATDLKAVLRVAGVASAVVIAGSNGCSTAMRFALLHPEKVDALVLCWPVNPANEWLRQEFERSAELVEQIGPDAYLKYLREEGIPEPNEDRVGFPFGFALLHDGKLASSFHVLGAKEAAERIRKSGEVLLAGDLLRGVSRKDAAQLAKQPFTIQVMPASPANPVHTLEIAQQVANLVSNSQLLPGFPESPTPRFPAVRSEFLSLLHEVISANKPG